MKIETIQTKRLKPNPANPRTIRDDKFRKLVQSIREFPKMLEIRPIVVNAQNEVLGGNMRLRACIEAGLTEVPIIRAETLTDDEQRRFIITDNAGFGEWDWEALANEWDAEELADWGLDVPADFGAGDGGEAQDDGFEMPDEVQTDIQPGDLFEIGPHRIICGDSTSEKVFDLLFMGQKASIAFTSPPYNQQGGGMKYDYQGKSKSLYLNKKSDTKSASEYFDFCIKVLDLIRSNTKEEGAVFWNVMYNASSRDDYGRIIFCDQNRLKVKETIIWDKTHPFPTASKGILSRRCELVFLMSAAEKYFTNQGENEVISNYWEVNSNGSQIDGHTACYPVGLPRKGIELCSINGDTVLDPFLGSGTTMVAAHQLGRVCYGIEIDPKYCQVIVDRMKKLDPSLEVRRNGQEFKTAQ